eukprot:TRINITY_DN29_c0_g1_i1.p2 TRINITY_DN29_c0_g1~~TRINITY_DN29_c0_g1_i1.p2  ORF type:complete len:76 (-),score=13.38 TRINITY_DN29_c0_g1_i1:190-417(-)
MQPKQYIILVALIFFIYQIVIISCQSSDSPSPTDGTSAYDDDFSSDVVSSSDAQMFNIFYPILGAIAFILATNLL